MAHRMKQEDVTIHKETSNKLFVFGPAGSIGMFWPARILYKDKIYVFESNECMPYGFTEFCGYAQYGVEQS